MHHLALHRTHLPLGRRPQIRAIDGSTHVPLVPEAFAHDRRDRHAGAHVEDEGYGAAVEVSACVAEGVGDGEVVDGAGEGGVRGGDLGGYERDLVADCGVEVLLWGEELG